MKKRMIIYLVVLSVILTSTSMSLFAADNFKLIVNEYTTNNKIISKQNFVENVSVSDGSGIFHKISVIPIEDLDKVVVTCGANRLEIPEPTVNKTYTAILRNASTTLKEIRADIRYIKYEAEVIPKNRKYFTGEGLYFISSGTLEVSPVVDIYTNTGDYTVETTLDSKTTSNRDNNISVKKDDKIEYIFSTARYTLIDYFNIKCKCDGSNNQLYLFDKNLFSNKYKATTQILDNGTVKLTLYDINGDIIISPVTKSINYDYYDKYYENYPNGYYCKDGSCNNYWYAYKYGEYPNNNYKTYDNATINKKIMKVSYEDGKYLAEVDVMTRDEKYALNRIELFSGNNKRTIISRLDNHHKHNNQFYPIEWFEDDNGIEHAKFFVQYNDFLNINSFATYSDDYITNLNKKDNYEDTNKKNNINYKTYRLSKNTGNNTKIYFSTSSPAKSGEQVGIEVQATSIKYGINKITLNIGNKTIYIKRNAKSYEFNGKYYPVVWDEENGMEVLNTVVDVVSDLKVKSESAKKSILKPMNEISNIEKPKLTAYIQGYNSNTFRPLSPVSKAESIKMLVSLFAHPSDHEISRYIGMGNYADVDNGWYSGIINYAHKSGYTSVLPKTYTPIETLKLGASPMQTFEPNRPITRAEFTALVLHFTKQPVMSYSTNDMPYYDVPNDSWAFNQIIEATKLGLIKGNGGYFRPAEGLTRAEAVAIINRATGRPRLALTKYKLNFSDVTKADWYYWDVVSAANNLY